MSPPVTLLENETQSVNYVLTNEANTCKRPFRKLHTRTL